MGFFEFLRAIFYVVIIMVGALISAESTVVVHFDRVPPAQSRFSYAVFKYSIKRSDASDACRNNECSLHCEVSFLFIIFIFCACVMYFIAS